MQRISFNENWTFIGGSGTGLFAMLAGGAPTPVTVNLPHDAVIGTERVDDPTLHSVAFYQAKNVCYTKKFEVPADWADKCVWIEFEGIYQNALVYVNNAFAGSARYGYGGHFFDIRKFLEPGKTNEVKVVVKNGANPAGRWYTGGGIYRDVTIHVGSRLHIKCTGTRASAESVEADQATVRVITPLAYDGCDVITAVVKNEILDAEGNVVSEDHVPVTFFDREPRDIRQRLLVPEPKLWDVDTPYLYTVRTTLTVDGETVDTYEDTFGIRYMQLDVKKGLRINGKTVKLRGGCIHHDNGVLGAATFYDSEERRVRIMKEMGYNAIRMAHHPMSKAMLRACDRLGMYVMDEFADVWSTAKSEFDYGVIFEKEYPHDAAQLALKDYNHPCVILYSIGNEIPETGNKFDAAFGRKITEIIRSIDDTRYVMNSVNFMLAIMDHMGEIMASMGMDGQGSGEINSMMSSIGDATGALSSLPIASTLTEEAFGQLDVSGYNYAEDRYESDQTAFPNRIMVGSETFPNKLAKNWALIEKFPNVIGDFAWTSWDYLGEVGIGQVGYEGEPGGAFSEKFPFRLAVCGTIDINGKPQPVAYWRQIVWGLRKEPYIAVNPPAMFEKKLVPGAWGFTDAQSTWNWPGYEGKPIRIEVYSDAPEVELFVNGKSVGKKAVGEELPCMVKFETTYEPGEVKAVAVKDSESAEFVLTSASDEVELVAAAERDTIDSFTGVGYVNICFADKNGIVNFSKNAPVTVEVEGGELVGLGSTDPRSNENYTGSTVATWQGSALAVVRALKPGTVTIKVSAEGFGTKTVAITAQ